MRVVRSRVVRGVVRSQVVRGVVHRVVSPWSSVGGPRSGDQSFPVEGRPLKKHSHEADFELF